MKTTSSIAKRCPPSFTRRASLAAISLAAAMLVTIRPVFAQTDDGFVPARSIEPHGIPMTSNLDARWDVAQPSLADPALAPAPKEPVEPPLSQINETFMPRVNGGLVEPWNDPAIPYLQPMVVSRPNSIGMPGGGLPYPLR
jgi:hypothetical protein